MKNRNILFVALAAQLVTTTCEPTGTPSPSQAPTASIRTGTEYVVTSSPIECCSGVPYIYLRTSQLTDFLCIAVLVGDTDDLWDLDLPRAGDYIRLDTDNVEIHDTCVVWESDFWQERNNQKEKVYCKWTTVTEDILFSYEANNQAFVGAVLYAEDTHTSSSETYNKWWELVEVPKESLENPEVLEVHEGEWTAYQYELDVPRSLIQMIFNPTSGKLYFSNTRLGIFISAEEPTDPIQSIAGEYWMDDCALERFTGTNIPP